MTDQRGGLRISKSVNEIDIYDDNNYNNVWGNKLENMKKRAPRSRPDRDKYEIYTNILRECYRDSGIGIKTTSLMYRTFTSYQQLTDTATFFTNKGLLELKDDRFFITEKGVEVFNILLEMSGMVIIN